MTGFDLPSNFTEDPESLVRKARNHFGSPSREHSEVDPASFVPSASTSMANHAEKTLREYSAPSADQVPTGPVIKNRNGNFEIKTGLITMVQASTFYGKPNEDASAHLQQFLELCSTFTIRGVEEDAIRLRLFPFSILGKAKQWFYANRTEINTWAKCSAAFLTNSFRWAKPMSFGGKFQVSSRQQMRLSQKLGRGSRSTSWRVLIMGWTTGLFFRVSIMG